MKCVFENKKWTYTMSTIEYKKIFKSFDVNEVNKILGMVVKSINIDENNIVKINAISKRKSA